MKNPDMKKARKLKQRDMKKKQKLKKVAKGLEKTLRILKEEGVTTPLPSPLLAEINGLPLATAEAIVNRVYPRRAAAA